MIAGIIAAGLGERLRVAGVPKPLVPVAGKPLIHWTVEGLAFAGAESITILLNSAGRPARRSLEEAFPRIAWRFLEWDSPSSWESFRRVCAELSRESDRFVVSTVDAVARPEDVARFAARALSPSADAALAVTGFVDDEKPLWVDVRDGWATAVGDRAEARRWVTCGLYGMSRAAAAAQADADHSRLRDYWTSLIEGGARVAAVKLGKTIDVDRPEDLASAEGLLQASPTGRRAVVGGSSQASPGSHEP